MLPNRLKTFCNTDNVPSNEQLNHSHSESCAIAKKKPFIRISTAQPPKIEIAALRAFFFTYCI